MHVQAYFSVPLIFFSSAVVYSVWIWNFYRGTFLKLYYTVERPFIDSADSFFFCFVHWRFASEKTHSIFVLYAGIANNAQTIVRSLRT
jgi:hypothetical protein